MFPRVQKNNKGTSGKVQQKVKLHKPSQSFVFIQKKQNILNDQHIVMKPKVLREETMIEMEVDETIASSDRLRQNNDKPMALDDLTVVPVNEKKDQTPTHGGYTGPMVPLSENYLKYCQNFKPKKLKSRKLAQKENIRAQLSRSVDGTKIKIKDPLDEQLLKKDNAKQYQNQFVAPEKSPKNYQTQNHNSVVMGDIQSKVSFKSELLNHLQKRDLDLRKRSMPFAPDDSTRFDYREPLEPTSTNTMGHTKNSVQIYKKSDQKKQIHKQSLSMSIDDTSLSFKKATNYEHVLKEILNTRDEIDDSQNKIVDLVQVKNNQQSSNAPQPYRVTSNNLQDQADTLLPITQLMGISEVKSNDFDYDNKTIRLPGNKKNHNPSIESTIKKLMSLHDIPATMTNIQNIQQTLNVHNQSSMETGQEQQSLLTLGGAKHVPIADPTICSSSTYIPPRDGDIGAFVEDRQGVSKEKDSDQEEPQSSIKQLKELKHLSHMTRIKLFEQEKKRKLDQARKIKEKTEMENVTFQPVLVARKKSTGSMKNSRNVYDTLAKPIVGVPSRNQLYLTNHNCDKTGSLRSQSKIGLDTTKFLSQNDGSMLMDTPKLGTNHNSKNKEVKPKVVSQSVNLQNHVFNRLFQDSQKLQTKHEERRKKYFEDTLSSYFKPHINSSIHAKNKSMRGRQRQSLDLQNQTIKLENISNMVLNTTANQVINNSKDHICQQTGNNAFQGRSKSQSNTCGLEDLLRLPKAYRIQNKPWDNTLMSPKDINKTNIYDKKSSMSNSKNQDLKRMQIKSVRSSTDPTEMVPCCQLNISQLETSKDINLDSTQNQTSLAWLFSKRSVFEILSQDAIRRQRKWRQQSQHSQKQSNERQPRHKRQTSAKASFKVSEQSNLILKNKMMKELDVQVTQIANKYGVRLHSPAYDQILQGCDENSIDSGDQGEEQLTIPQFKRLLKDIQIISSIQELDDSKKSRESQDVKNILKLMTPIGSSKPILTCRNIRAVIYAILNIHEDWMSEQDALEHRHSKEDMSIYKRKIWKYKMMINKLQSDMPEALAQSSKQALDLLENVSPEKIMKLNESERQLYILRHTVFKEPTGALFRGRSLCVDQQAVRKVSKYFERLKQCFFKFIISRIKKQKLSKEKKMFKEMITSQNDLIYNSAFKQKTRMQTEKSEMLRQNFLEMSKKKEQASSQKKARRSASKPIKFIIQSNSRERLHQYGDSLGYDHDDLQLRPKQTSQQPPNLNNKPNDHFTTLHQQQPMPIQMPVTKYFLSPSSPTSSSFQGVFNRDSIPSSNQIKDQSIKQRVKDFQQRKYSGNRRQQVTQSHNNVLSINIEEAVKDTRNDQNVLKPFKHQSATSETQKTDDKKPQIGTYQQMIEHKRKIAEQKRKRAGLSKYISKVKPRPTYMDQISSQQQSRQGKKPIASLVPASRSRNKIDCYSQANLLNNQKKQRNFKMFDTSFNSRKNSMSALFNKSANNSFSLKPNLNRRSYRVSTQRKQTKSLAMSKNIGPINETKESSEPDIAQNLDQRSNQDLNQFSNRNRSYRNSSLRRKHSNASPFERPNQIHVDTFGNLNDSNLVSAEPQTSHTAKDTERDIQQIVNQKMGGVTTKQLIEKQLQEMFGSRQKDRGLKMY